MGILNITDSSVGLNSTQIPKRVQKNNEPGILKQMNTMTFISDFISATDEITKLNSSSEESQKPEKKGRPFSQTSENWIG